MTGRGEAGRNQRRIRATPRINPAEGGGGDHTPVLARLRTDPLLVAFVAASLAGGVAIGLATGASSIPIYVVSMLLAMALVARVDAGVHFDRMVLWGLALWLPAHLIGGLWVLDGRVMYAHWIVEPVVRYDNVVHAFGFGVAGLATLRALARNMPAPSRAAVFFVVWFGGMAIGAVNEIIEWVGTKVQTTTNVGDFDNSMRDLVANALGSGLAGWWAARRARPGTSP